jgi:hypothetical protein
LDLAGNKAEQLITISVKETNLSTSIVWNGIGDDNKINANEMAVTTLSGTVAGKFWLTWFDYINRYCYRTWVRNTATITRKVNSNSVVTLGKF